MKRNFLLILVALLVSQFIYLLYRTEKTVINQIFISIFSVESFSELQLSVQKALPLHDRIVYSLPEGLWIFCVTITSKGLFIKMRKRVIDLIYVPLLFSFALELFQLFHITNGRFDFWDFGFSIVFWLGGVYLVKEKATRQNIFNPINNRSWICVLSFLIVYLSHAWE